MKAERRLHKLVSRSVRFGTIVSVSLFAATTGWAQSDIQTSFNPLPGIVDARPKARPQPATITSDDGTTLRSKGYILVGLAAAQRPETRGGQQALDELRAALLRTAGESGGDLVSILPSSLHAKVDVPTGKTKKECVDTKTVSGPSTSIFHQVCDMDVHGFQHCHDVWDGMEAPTALQCTAWADVPVTKKQKVLALQGMVWSSRYGPAKATEPSWATTHLQDVKVGVQDKAQLIAWFGQPTINVPGGSLRGPLHRHEGCVDSLGWNSVQVEGARTTIKNIVVDLDAKGLVCDMDYAEACLEQRQGMTKPEKIACTASAAQ
jgi:hypothetical protein